MDADAGRMDAGRRDAVSRAEECWRQISERTDSLQQSETGQECPTNNSVVTEMLRAGSEGRTEEAADILEQGFEQWDRQNRSSRLQEYADGVRLEWEAAVKSDWWTVWQSDEEEKDGDDLEGCFWDRVVVVTNLAGNVTEDMLEGTFEQVGELLRVQMGDCCADVEFRWAADAEKAVKGFDGVELVGMEMECQVKCRSEEEELGSDY